MKPPDPRIRLVTDAWATAWRESGRADPYPWDLALHGKQSQDRAAALRCIAIWRVPEHDGVDVLGNLQGAMLRYLRAQDGYREKGLTDADPTLDRFGCQAQRWHGDAAEAGDAYCSPSIPVYGVGVGP